MSFIAVICGLKSEASAVRAALGERADIRIYVSGADAARAYGHAKDACDAGASFVVSVGVSGGLDPALQPGDLIIGTRVIAGDGTTYEVDSALLDGLNPAHGVLYGSNEIIETPEQKRELFGNTSALAVDMESHGAAKAAKEADVPFLAIRAIADPADRALPPAALGAVAPDGSTRVFKTLGAAMRDPKQFPDLMKLGADSAAATKALRDALPAAFAVLLPAIAQG